MNDDFKIFSHIILILENSVLWKQMEQVIPLTKGCFFHSFSIIDTKQFYGLKYSTDPAKGMTEYTQW